MRTIHKFPLVIGVITVVALPSSAAVLCAQMQYGELCIWVLLDDPGPKASRKFAVYGTGQEFPQVSYDYIDTVQQADGALVWHVFELVGPL